MPRPLIKELTIKLFFLTLGLGLFIGAQQLCYRVTLGFDLSKIYDDLPIDSTYEVPIASRSNEATISALLDQSYHLLACGAECYAFESEDQTTILKLFKMHKNRSFYFRKVYEGMHDLLHPQLYLMKAMNLRQQMLIKTFKSIILAYQELKHETALLAIHLNPTPRFYKTVSLIDGLGNCHPVPIDNVRFVLQQKATPVFAHLSALLKEGRRSEAKESIASLVDLIILRCKKGIGDRDPVLRTNLAFLGNRAIEIDLGSFSKNEYLKQESHWKRELHFQTIELIEWLDNVAPLFAKELDEELMAIFRSN